MKVWDRATIGFVVKNASVARHVTYWTSSGPVVNNYTHVETRGSPNHTFAWQSLTLLRQGLSEPDFYSDLVYKLKKIVGSNNFSAQFIKIISHYKKDWL